MSLIPSVDEHREVVYCDIVGTFNLSNCAIMELYHSYPDIFPIVPAEVLSSPCLKTGRLPEVINYSELSEGLELNTGRFVKGKDGYVRYVRVDNEINRADRRLIEIIKRIGLAASSGENSELAIQEVKPGYVYSIHEYYGKEYVDVEPDYKSIIMDLTHLVQTGERDFKCALTESILRGDQIY